MSERACPRLIEVALPIRGVSTESLRDKSLGPHRSVWGGGGQGATLQPIGES